MDYNFFIDIIFYYIIFFIIDKYFFIYLFYFYNFYFYFYIFFEVNLVIFCGDFLLNFRFNFLILSFILNMVFL